MEVVTEDIERCIDIYDEVHDADHDAALLLKSKTAESLSPQRVHRLFRRICSKGSSLRYGYLLTVLFPHIRTESMQLIAVDFSDMLKENVEALIVILGCIHTNYYASKKGGKYDNLAIELLSCFTEEQVKTSKEAMEAYKAHEAAITKLRAARARAQLVEYHSDTNPYTSRMQLRAQGNKDQ